MYLRSFTEAGNFNECFILLLLTVPWYQPVLIPICFTLFACAVLIPQTSHRAIYTKEYVGCTYLKCHSCLSLRKSAAACLKVKLFKTCKLVNSKISTQIQNWRFLFFCILHRTFSFYYFLLVYQLLSKILAPYLQHSFLLIQSENQIHFLDMD